MSGGIPSFQKLDYLLRPNKNIERKLVFEILESLKKNFKNHIYLGFGSMWFGDFIIAHRQLGLEKMISMEKEDHVERAEYNKPYQCIKVLPGFCDKILDDFTDEIWKNPFISWFDFDTVLTVETITVIDIFSNKCATGSVFILTFDASARKYRADPQNVNQKSFQDTSAGKLRDLLSESITGTFEELNTKNGELYKDPLTDELFPEFFANKLLEFIEHKVLFSGKRHSFLPIFNFYHRDGAPMITVGGAIVPKLEKESWKNDLLAPFPLMENGKLKFQKLDFIPITLREKIELDRLLPNPSKEDFLDNVKKIGIQLENDVLERYWQYYRFFPVFVETPI